MSSRAISENAPEWFGMRAMPTPEGKTKRRVEKEGPTQNSAVLGAGNRKRLGDRVEGRPGLAVEQIDHLDGVEPDSDAPTDVSTNPDYIEDDGHDECRR